MSITKILIVEDEPKVSAFLKEGLEENGYEAKIAGDGLSGKTMALSQQFNLIILDINLPQLNGFQLCKIVRENNPDIPIIMLTALGGLEEKVKGFDFGADDYLLKPFEFAELLVRIKALLKRVQPKAQQSNIIEIADLVINRTSKTISRSKTDIDLSAKEYQLLEYLAINKEKVVSRIELTEKIWGINFDTGTNVVDVYINFLRKKMDHTFHPKLIHTRIGLGYVLKDTLDE